MGVCDGCGLWDVEVCGSVEVGGSVDVEGDVVWYWYFDDGQFCE